MSLPSDHWFHPDRRAHYLSHAGGDRALADRLCRWDQRLRNAVFHDVDELHHALVASYSAAFDRRWNGLGVCGLLIPGMPSDHESTPW